MRPFPLVVAFGKTPRSAALDIVSDPEEHSEWRWVPVSEAIERVWSWTNRDALELLRDGRSPGISWPK